MRHHYVAELEKAKALRAAKIVLNTFTHKETDGVNCRLFEATACGGFVLSENRPTIQISLRRGKRSRSSILERKLLDQVRYYLSHPEERERIAIEAMSGRTGIIHTRRDCESSWSCGATHRSSFV